MPHAKRATKVVQDAVMRQKTIDLALAGHNQAQIATLTNRSQPAVCKMIQRLGEDWKKESMKGVGEMRAKQMAQLQDLLTKHSDQYKNGGDPFKALEGSRKVLTDIAKLFGLNQEKIDIKQDITVTEGVDPDILASKLASVFSDDDIADGVVVEPAALEHDTDATPGDDSLDDDTTPEPHEAHEDGIVGDHIDDAEEALSERPEAPDDTILDDLPCAPPPTRTGPNPGPVIGRMRPQLPGNDSVADDLSERLAARFST